MLSWCSKCCGRDLSSEVNTTPHPGAHNYSNNDNVFHKRDNRKWRHWQLKRNVSHVSPMTSFSKSAQAFAEPSNESSHLLENNMNANSLDYMAPLANVISTTEVDEAVENVIKALFKSSMSVCTRWQWLNDALASGEKGWEQPWTLLNHIKLVNSEQSCNIIDFKCDGQRNENYSILFASRQCNHRYGIALSCEEEMNYPFSYVITFTCDKFNHEDYRIVEILNKNIQWMFSRLHRLQQFPQTQADELKYPRNSSHAQPSLQLIWEKFDILHETDSISLQKKSIEVVKTLTNSNAAFFLFFQSENHEEMFCEMFDENPLEEELILPMDGNPFYEVVKRKCPLWLDDLSETVRKSIAKLLSQLSTSFILTSLLMIPIFNHSRDEATAIVILLNKRIAENFCEQDVVEVQECFYHIGHLLVSSVGWTRERRHNQQLRHMCKVAANIFSKLDNVSVLLKEIIFEARNITNAERCAIFLVEEETQNLVAKVFDGLPDDPSKAQSMEIRIPLNAGIAGYVATTGEMLNIKNAYESHFFYRAVDESTGFKTKSILCFPIKDENGKVIGVAQLCNKKNGPHFTRSDEEIAGTFAAYCCISLVHSLMYKRVQDAQHRSKLANELMTYHMKVADDKVSWLTTCDIPTVNSFLPNFNSFQSIPRQIVDNKTLLSLVSMMEELDFLRQYRISRNTLAKFLLMVNRGYRNPPYHNWSHAFSVAHFAYLCITNLSLQDGQYLGSLELLAYFIGSLCHDIDHRGTNNSFQVASQSILASLYSSEGSVLERHHLSQTMCIIHTEGCNIFENLSSQEYCQVLDRIRDIILATDLAHHLRIFREIKTMAEEGYDVTQSRHHYLLLSLLMTAADLSDQTKDWSNTRSVAELIYQEFFSQGDLEKQLGHKPAEQMDRDRACVPDLQVSFLDDIAAPCFRLLTELFPNANPILSNIHNNRSKWLLMSEMVRKGQISSSSRAIFHENLPEIKDNSE